MMRRMDAEYSGKGTCSPDEVEELKTDIEQSGKHLPRMKKGEQDPEIRAE
jgi:hypothetical protein